MVAIVQKVDFIEALVFWFKFIPKGSNKSHTALVQMMVCAEQVTGLFVDVCVQHSTSIRGNTSLMIV